MKTSFGTQLSRSEMKTILGGVSGVKPPTYCGSTQTNGCCNAYCGQGSGVTCSGTCASCEDAGNGKGPGPGQDKICYQF